MFPILFRKRFGQHRKQAWFLQFSVFGQNSVAAMIA